MKNKKINQILLLLVGVMMIFSCSENEDVYPETRLFRPVLNSNLTPHNNTIIVDMAKMTKAVSYKIELSRDKFVTVLGTIDTPESTFRIVNLLWNTEYQIRVTAIAANPEFNSKVSDLGSVTTERFPSIMQIPTVSDVIDVAAKVHWLTGVGTGAAVTQVKVFAIADEALKTPLFTYAVSSAEQLAGEKIINGLTPATQYQLAIYSGDEVRGWEKYTTKDAIVTGANVVDLRGIVNNPDILVQTMKTAASGSTILLDGDYIYNSNDGTATYKFDKSFTIKSGYSFNPAGATISFLTKEFDLAVGANVASIVFDGVTLSGIAGSSGNYVFGINPSGTIGEIKFVNCKINKFRGILRTKTGTGVLDKFIIDNCIITDINSYGILNIDVATWSFNDAIIKNSTIYQVLSFLVSKSNSKSILIENCTLSEVPAKTRAMFSWATAGQDNVLNGITIKNTIIGRGWETTAGGADYAVSGIKGLGATNFITTNSYATADFKYTLTGLPIPTFPSFTYSKTISDLWIDPTKGNFAFKDTGFAGIKDSGDPRWRK
jgi:hypothetical protein